MTQAANDARTPPVAVWQVLEKMSREELAAWRVADLAGRPAPETRNLDVGFPFGWYPFMLGRDLAVGEVKPARYFGRDLAVWRGEDGQVRMLDAYCKHLGAHMGHGGKVAGNLLECPFHAWRYDGDEGTVKDIPYARAVPPQVKRKCTRNWHIREANQWLWVWYHPEDAAPLYDVAVLPETSDPAWTPFDFAEWKVFGSLQNMAENGVDFAHFKYIHGTAEVPEAELSWGEWDRCGIVRARMGTPKGVVDGTITSNSMGPGRPGCALPGSAKRCWWPASFRSSWISCRWSIATPSRANRPKARLPGWRGRSSAMSTSSSIRTRWCGTGCASSPTRSFATVTARSRISASSIPASTRAATEFPPRRAERAGDQME